MNRAGRPRGTGGKPTKHAGSPAVAAANRENAKKPRPGRQHIRRTDAEALRAYRADALGRVLCLQTVRQASRYLAMNARVLDLFENELRDPECDAKRLESLAGARMQASEITRMLEAVHNRWGQPPRSVMEVNAGDRPPVMMFGPFDQWRAKEGAHAAAGAAGNCHAGNGHTEH